MAVQIVLLVFYRHESLKGKNFKDKKGSKSFDSTARSNPYSAFLLYGHLRIIKMIII